MTSSRYSRAAAVAALLCWTFGGAICAPAQDAPTADAASKAASLQPLTALRAEHVGRTILVTARIANILPAPNKDSGPVWYMTDGQGVVRVVLPAAMSAGAPEKPPTFAMGRMATVEGIAKIEQGIIEIRPETSESVKAAADDAPQGCRLPSSAGATEVAAPAAAVSEETLEKWAERLNARLPGKVDKSLVDQDFALLGKITAFRASWSERAPNILTIEGGGGTIDLVYWRDVDETLEGRRDDVTAVGHVVFASGNLGEYRERLQFRVQEGGALEKVDDKGERVAGPAPKKTAASVAEKPKEKPKTAAETQKPASAPGETLSPSQVSDAMKDTTVRIRGKVDLVRESRGESAPTRVTLSDGDGAITVVFWADKAERFSGANAPVEGKPWAVEGKVAEYNGQLQIRAEQIAPATDAQATAEKKENKKDKESDDKKNESAAAAAPKKTAAASAPAPSDALAPSKIKDDMVGKTVRLRGNVTEVRLSHSDAVPTRVVLGDGDGKITVVYWSDKADRFTGSNAPVEGKPWGVEGRVADFNGLLQIRAEKPLGK